MTQVDLLHTLQRADICSVYIPGYIDVCMCMYACMYARSIASEMPCRSVLQVDELMIIIKNSGALALGLSAGQIVSLAA